MYAYCEPQVLELEPAQLDMDTRLDMYTLNTL